MPENGCGTDLMRRIRSRTESGGGGAGAATRTTRGARTATATTPRRRTTTTASAWPEGVHKQSSERSEGSGWRESRWRRSRQSPEGAGEAGFSLFRSSQSERRGEPSLSRGLSIPKRTVAHVSPSLNSECLTVTFCCYPPALFSLQNGYNHLRREFRC